MAEFDPHPSQARRIRGEASPVDPSWRELSAAYPGHPALMTDEVYSLPIELLDAIVTLQNFSRRQNGSSSDIWQNLLDMFFFCSDRSAFRHF